MYDPATGRFLQRDSLLKSGPGSQGLHRYAYVGNNPVNLTDPSGNCPVCAVAPAAPAISPWVVAGVGTVIGRLIVFGDQIAEGLQDLRLPELSIPNTLFAHDFPYPDDPTHPPGEGWEWRGRTPVGGSRGNWYNPKTGESLHPDLGYPEPIGPHWDYKDPDGKWWRLFPDGRVEPKS